MSDHPMSEYEAQVKGLELRITDLEWRLSIEQGRIRELEQQLSQERQRVINEAIVKYKSRIKELEEFLSAFKDI